MAGQMSKHKINIGLTSLILIFIILCLATFSLLSLSSARGDQSLAARSARAVTEYYRADAPERRRTMPRRVSKISSSRPSFFHLLK